jgi:hypothetical protein
VLASPKMDASGVTQQVHIQAATTAEKCGMCSPVNWQGLRVGLGLTKTTFNLSHLSVLHTTPTQCGSRLQASGLLGQKGVGLTSPCRHQLQTTILQ